MNLKSFLVNTLTKNRNQCNDIEICVSIYKSKLVTRDDINFKAVKAMLYFIIVAVAI